MPDLLEHRPKGDVVFCFSYLTWQAVTRRGWFGTEDRLARGLLENERVERVLVCDQMRSLPAMLVRDLTRHRGDARAVFPGGRSRQLLRPTRLRREYPTSIGAIERACARFDRAARRAARHMGLSRPAVVVANPLLAGFAAFDWAGPVTFFATDDWLAYEPYRRWWPAYEESFARIRERGRRVAAVSAAALRRIAPVGRNEVIPNGVDPDEWLAPATQPPACTTDAGGPLLVYAGTLDARLDVEALLELALGMPDARLVLVGPLLDGPHLEPLRAVSNIHIRPPLDRTEVIALIRSANVGLVPHRDNALTRAMSPLKLFEYLAAGLPVAASDLPPMRDIDPSVSLVRAGGSYLPAVVGALKRGRADEDARSAFIAEHSWRARHDSLLDLALG